MKRTTVLRVLLVAVLLGAGLSLLAQTPATPAPATTAITFAGVLTYAQKHPLQAGAFLTGLIYGLRNVPWFADIFVRWPKFGLVVNALTSLFVQVGACLQNGMNEDFPMCLLNAVGMFLSAAGVHMAVSSVATGRTESGSAKLMAMPNGSVVSKETGHTVDGPKASRATIPPMPKH